MSQTELFVKTKHFIEDKLACQEALKELGEGIEISIVLEERIDCACFYSQKAQLEDRKAKNPDVEFSVNSEAVRRLETIAGDNLAETGIEILREVIAGNIKIKIVSSVTHVLTNGYLKIIKKAGPDFFAFLSQHGLTHIFKVMAYIRSMKKN